MGGEKERGIFRAATAEQIGKVTNARLKIGLSTKFHPHAMAGRKEMQDALVLVMLL